MHYVPSTLGQTPIAAHYRERARQALRLARTARRQGKDDAARGLADEALLWRAYAHDWGRRGLGALPG
jgi:hypothetical protein